MEKILKDGEFAVILNAPDGVPVMTKIDRSFEWLTGGYVLDRRRLFANAVQQRFGTTLASLQCAWYRPSFTVEAADAAEMSAAAYAAPCYQSSED